MNDQINQTRTSASIAKFNNNLFRVIGYVGRKYDKGRWEMEEKTVYVGSLDSCLDLYYSMFPDKLGEYDFLKEDE